MYLRFRGERFAELHGRLAWASSAVCWCRFWPEGRVALWEEKLALRPGFAGNAATAWGTVSEDTALQRCALADTSLSLGACVAEQRLLHACPLRCSTLHLCSVP